MMKFFTDKSFLFIIILIIFTHELHLQDSINPQLKALNNKQQYVRDQVIKLNIYASTINDQLQNTISDQQKIQILEQALTEERDRIFELKNQIIYPFNDSKTACLQLRDDQRTLYRQKLNKTRFQLAKLQQISKKLNPESLQVQQINDNIEKQQKILQNMQNILNITCKQILTPTIFQSNLKSKNWILGPQTMKDLKQEYAQRALIFHNITNCPLETPFYDPVAESCISCIEPTPLFDMFNKECTSCEMDEQLDSDKKICRSKPHWTNFTKIQNWKLDGGSLPDVDLTLTPCTDKKPYFNGVVCVQCSLPSYWSVSSNSCKKCQNGYQFDMNTKDCQKIMSKRLTLLQNTQWVSLNLTMVIEQRSKILQKNKTTGNYQYCPNFLPYFDGTTCVNCSYFDIDNLKCVSKPDATEYNQNMKRFLPLESSKQTNPQATRYISSSDSKLPNTDLADCNSSSPYYDGLACIHCLKPFQFFNLDEKKCILCESDQLYVQNLHKCIQRKRIMISSNFNQLLATPKVSISQYQQSLIKTINDNHDAIVTPCSNQNEYSNLTDCFTCSSKEYFNVESLICQICDGDYLNNTHMCQARVYVFTNLNAQNIIDLEDINIDQQKSRIKEFIQTHSGSYICPIQNPYLIENKTCGNCPHLFSYAQLKCKACAEYFIYVITQKQCVSAKMIVNFMNQKNILVTDSETLASFKEQEQQVKNQNPNVWMLCPADRPYTDSRDRCFNCSSGAPYFNYTIKQCQNCPQNFVFDSISSRCTQQFFLSLLNSQTQPRMIGYDNYTLNDFKIDEEAYKRTHPTVQCTTDKPFGTSLGCKQCEGDWAYFDIRKRDCSEVKYLINFQRVSPDYILPQGQNLDFYIAEEQKFRRQADFITKKCSDVAPYTNDRQKCFSCSAGEYFNFFNRQCEGCPDGQGYMRDLKACKQLFYLTRITPSTILNMKGYPDYTLDDYKRNQSEIKLRNPYQQCPIDRPFGTLNGCEQCLEPSPYFDLKRQSCSSAKKLINFVNIGNKYILGDNKNISQYQDSQNNFKLYSQSLTVECPVETPFTFDRETCFACSGSQNLFNFETKQCESCPQGSQFSVEKKQCLKLFYITNFNENSQKKMVSTKDYLIQNFKADQEKLRRQNPYKDCNSSQPYGTINGCKKCTIPQEYFDIKNSVCTAVEKLINFDSVGNNYILKEGKFLDDYKKDEQDYESSSDLLTAVCPAETPFTNNRNDCFSCKSSNPYFNFETKRCENCQSNETYDSGLRRCIEKQYYTLFTPTTENFLLESNDYKLNQYKEDQTKVKSKTGSAECPSTRPYATTEGCIACDSSSPYFNIASQMCQTCYDGKVFIQNDHQCFFPAYISDYSNANIKEEQGFSIKDLQLIEQNRASKPGYTTIKCSIKEPFALQDRCVSCDDPKAPYFNIKTLTCEGCIDFYQYFANKKCNNYIILTNTQYMIGYLEVDNYTKYNVQKMNNFTFIGNPNITILCPEDSPFFSIDNQCTACNLSTQPIFNLKQQRCMNIDFFQTSNPQFMKFYIENGGSTIVGLKKEIDVLRKKGVNVKLCPQEKPYLSLNECVTCPESLKYFDLATQVCKACEPGEKCIST